MGVDYSQLHDPNAEYTMRDLSAETVGVTRERGGTRDVEITDIQTTMVDGNFPWTLVRIYTDAGPVGTGEAYWGAGVPELIERMTPFLVGENPLDIDRLTEHLVQKMSGEGSIGGVTVTAISGIEVALHDLAGKILEVPPTSCWAASTATRCGSTETATPRRKPIPRPAPTRPSASSKNWLRRLKFDLDVPSGHEKDRANRHLRNPEIEHKATIVEKVTERVGDRADVAFDCHWTFSGGSAKRLAKRLEEYDVWWLEDPVPPENHDVQREVTQSTSTPITVGENVYRKHGQRRLLEEQAVDMIAPDMPKIGGMRETRKIADLADMYYVPVAMHNVASPVATVASAHVGAAIPNSLAVEYHSYELGWWADLVEEDVIEGGYIEIPEEPGLGVTLDMDVVEEHMVDGEELFDEA